MQSAVEVSETESAVPKTESAVPKTESAVPKTESAVPKTESAVPKTESAVPKTESDDNIVPEISVLVTESDNIQYPDHLHVSGMCLSLRGWNGRYSRIDNPRGGAPDYVMLPHTYFGLYIIGTRISHNGSRWVFQRQGEFGDYSDMFYGDCNKDDPTSGWDKFTVHKKHKRFREFCRNNFF
jgi:hypothetical protein